MTTQTKELSTEVKKQAITATKEWMQIFADGTVKITQAAKLYVKCLDTIPNYREIMQDKLEQIPDKLLYDLERIGREQLIPEILNASGRWASDMRRVPISDQRYAIKNGIEVLTKNGDTLKVKVTHLNNEQRRQVFAFDHIRSLSEQRAFIENEKLKENQASAYEKDIFPYRIDKNRKVLIVKRGVELDKATLLRILGEI